ncbi:MAG TPA: carbonic anhydrase family protein [Chromatiales bacterium]|nr:carbonic anhydrase family protein [Chromatiales bacterium]
MKRYAIAIIGALGIAVTGAAFAGEGEHHGTVHWGYEGEGAPFLWGSLKEEFATCGEGKSQSPIDISSVIVTELPAIQVDYKATPLEILNNGHAVQVNYGGGSRMTVGGKSYQLLQFHFHAPSEHTIGGKYYPMVAHLVHKADDGSLGVIGVMMKEGAENALIKTLWDHLPAEAGQKESVADVSINVADLLPVDRTYFNYSGSLTTPPCTEGVNWMVLAAPVSVSAEQIKQYTDILSGTNRPVQPLNGRTIRLSN